MNLDMLKKALEPLDKFGKNEISIEIDGTEIFLKPLLPAEEVACQKYANTILAQLKDEVDFDTDSMARHAALDYFDKFRIEVISYALVQVGDTDFRGVRTIETGETLANGIQKKMPINVALRQLIEGSWSRAMITICFARYGDLISELATLADKVAEKSISDIDAEIQRVTTRLENLQKEREERAKGDPSVTTKQIKNLVEVGNVIERENRELAEAQERRVEQERLEKEKQEMGVNTEVKTERKSVIPETSTPPTPGPTQPPAQEQKVEEDPVQVQDIGGIPAYRLPSQTLSERGREGNKEAARKSSINPNFKPRK